MRAGLAAIVLTLVSSRALAQTDDVDNSGLREPGSFQLQPPETIRRSHPVRAVLETGLAFALNVAWYWWDADFNSPDWDLHWDWPSWKKKLTFEAVRLDSNRFSTNAGSHTEGGTLIYLIGRGNGLSVGSSTLLSFGEVVVWEYIGEFYEKPSINDMINNPLGGMAVGEPFHQLSEFFSRGADNGINQILAAVFSPLSPANGWVDKQRPRRAGQLDGLGLPRDVWHRFDFSSGVASARFSEGTQRTESWLGLRTRINTVPGYARPFPRAGFFGAGRITSIDAGIGLGEEGTTGALFATRVGLAGYHAQNLHLDGDEVAGTSLLLSLTNTFDYSHRRRPGLPLDQIATFGVAGPVLDLVQRRGPLEGALHLEAMPELAMVTSMAADSYRARSGTEGLKSVLAEYGYYYAYGAGLGGQLALRFHVVEGGLDLRWERFGSIEGLDRFQERLNRDFHQVDGRSRSLIWLGVRPFGALGDIAVSLERSSRVGKMADVQVTSAEQRGTLTLTFGL